MRILDYVGVKYSRCSKIVDLNVKDNLGKVIKDNYIFIGDYRVPVRGGTLEQVFLRIFGLNFSRAQYLCASLGLSLRTPLFLLQKDCINQLNHILRREFLIGRRLRRTVFFFKQDKVRLGLYQGLRYRMGLPCRGQRTRANAKTVKRLRRIS